MNSVNKTLYIPLYGKAYVSKKRLFLRDPMAEAIWEAEGFTLRGKSKSKWLAYYMGMRAAVFDQWVTRAADVQETVVIHIGCGLDSRVLRTGGVGHKWYDVDFAEVVEERKRYYADSADYRMIAGDVREGDWLAEIPERKHAVVVMEGVSMYLTPGQLQALFSDLCAHFEQISLLLDCYTVMAAKMSKYKNPVRDVGVTGVFGIDDPLLLQQGALTFVKEHTMIPRQFIEELHGVERIVFSKLYAGSFTKKLYRLFEYRKL